MNSNANWQSLLINSPLINHRSPDLDQVVVCPLDYQSLIDIQGPDTESFLQGQLTCDMREVTSSGSAIAAHCNPKGSMLSLMRVIKHKAGYLLRTNSRSLELTLANLNKYMMFSKAQSSDLSAARVGLGIYGKKAGDFITSEFANCPDELNQVIQSNNTTITKVPGERYEIWMDMELAKRWVAQSIVQQNLYSSEHWHQQDIINGIADIYPENSGDFIPQMCNLQALGGVSFQKGCYTGQEIITRLHFRGKLNKQLILCSFQAPLSQLSLEIGQNIVNASQKVVGKLLQNSCIEKQHYLQAIVNHRDVEQALFLEDTTELKVLALPYTLDPALFTRKD